MSDIFICTPFDNKIVIKRTPRGVATNVEHRVIHHSPDGFEFGYGGSGPADLALNILESALMVMKHKGERTKCFQGTCFTLAWILHQDFKRDYIASMNPGGETIPFKTVQAWIEKQCQDKRLCLTCGQRPTQSFAVEEGGRICPTCKTFLWDEDSEQGDG